MRAISIKEPWASLINDGRKTIETRTWQTKYRGQILLCASKKPESKISGHAFAIAILKYISPMEKKHEARAMCDVYPNAQAWVLENIVPITPFPLKGQLGLFKVRLHPKMRLKIVEDLRKGSEDK